MSRERKPLVVETLRDPASGRTIDVVMIWSTKRFCADPKDGQEPVEGATHAEVSALAQKLLKTSFAFTWRSVILVDVDDHVSRRLHGVARGDTHATTALRFERCELALKADGTTLVQRPHALDLPEGPKDWQEKRRAEGKDVRTLSYHHPDAELPYTQEAWDGLVALARIINQAHATLDKLVKTSPERLPLLASKGSPLLLAAPAPKGRRTEG